MIALPPWSSYSAKLVKAIVKPHALGVIKEAQEGMRLVIGEEGSFEEGNRIRFYLLVDEEDGEIADAKFQAYGETLLIGVAEILSELVLRKNHAQARRISAELIEKSVEDRALKKGLPETAAPYINLALDAMDQALVQCEDLFIPEEFLITPLDLSSIKTGEYPNWEALTHEERLALIKQVLEQEVAPYVQLDDGGVLVKELKEGPSLVIKYEGNCTTCLSATGSTLSAIQHILRARVHPALEVIPEL